MWWPMHQVVPPQCSAEYASCCETIQNVYDHHCAEIRHQTDTHTNADLHALRTHNAQFKISCKEMWIFLMSCCICPAANVIRLWLRFHCLGLSSLECWRENWDAGKWAEMHLICSTKIQAQLCVPGIRYTFILFQFGVGTRHTKHKPIRFICKKRFICAHMLRNEFEWFRYVISL